jgi:hypothetical protein
MKPRWQVGWILFAIVMVWAESMGDLPRLLFPHSADGTRFVIALANGTAVIGVVFYTLGITGSRPFWRVYAPLFAMVLAAQFGSGVVSLTRVVARLMVLGKDAPLVILAGVVVLLPMVAMATFTALALFRLGDWIGPTRRPVGLRLKQLSLPI